MTRHRFADVLQEIGDPRPASTKPIIDFIAAWSDRKAEEESRRHMEIEQAFADGRAEGERRAQAVREELSRQHELRSAEQLAAARKAWALEHGGDLATHVAQQIEGLSEALSALIADVLEPILAARSHQAGLAELTRSVRSIIDVKGNASVVVRGHDDVVAVVGESLAAAGIAHERVQAPATGVVISIDETTITANLATVLQRLEETTT